MLIHLNAVVSPPSLFKITNMKANKPLIELHVNPDVPSASDAMAIATVPVVKPATTTTFKKADPIEAAIVPLVQPIATTSDFKKPIVTMGKKELQQVIEEKNK